jgi:hypothetical protein
MNEQYIKIDECGDKFYFKEREMKILHREDGPAIEEVSGSKHWYMNGKLHREDGPAIEEVSGSKYWYLNDSLHREDGPAIEGVDGSKFWYLHGEELTQECYKITTRLERRNLLFTIEEIAQYINGWVTGPFDTVHEIGKGTLLNVLSQLECEQDGIVAFFNRRKGTTL